MLLIVHTNCCKLTKIKLQLFKMKYQLICKSFLKLCFVTGCCIMWSYFCLYLNICHSTATQVGDSWFLTSYLKPSHVVLWVNWNPKTTTEIQSYPDLLLTKYCTLNHMHPLPVGWTHILRGLLVCLTVLWG